MLSDRLPPVESSLQLIWRGLWSNARMIAEVGVGRSNREDYLDARVRGALPAPASRE